MKVLVIPDVHLKPWIFSQAAKLMKDGAADRAVCLMDIADDWNKEYDLISYEQTYDAAISFAREFPDTFWCYGNSCDVFSTFQNGKPIGTQVFPVIDTEKGELSAELQTVGDQDGNGSFCGIISDPGQGGRTLKKPNPIIRYENTIPAVFVRRVNRFVAEVLVEGRTETGEIQKGVLLSEILCPDRVIGRKL